MAVEVLVSGQLMVDSQPGSQERWGGSPECGNGRAISERS